MQSRAPPLDFPRCIAMQVGIELHDVAAPGPLALPGNKGALYIYIAICMGGIWLFSLVPMPFQLFIIHVRHHKCSTCWVRVLCCIPINSLLFARLTNLHRAAISNRLPIGRFAQQQVGLDLNFLSHFPPLPGLRLHVLLCICGVELVCVGISTFQPCNGLDLREPRPFLTHQL
jgi:hypothetical protein